MIIIRKRKSPKRRKRGKRALQSFQKVAQELKYFIDNPMFQRQLNKLKKSRKNNALVQALESVQNLQKASKAISNVVSLSPEDFLVLSLAIKLVVSSFVFPAESLACKLTV